MCKYCALDTSDDVRVNFCNDMNRPISLPMCEVFNGPPVLTYVYHETGEKYEVDQMVFGHREIMESFDHPLRLPKCREAHISAHYNHDLYLPVCTKLVIASAPQVPIITSVISAPMCKYLNAPQAEFIRSIATPLIREDNLYICPGRSIIVGWDIQDIRCHYGTIISAPFPKR